MNSFKCQCYNEYSYCPIHDKPLTSVKLKLRELANLPWGDGPYWRLSVIKLCKEILEELDGEK